VNDGNGVDSGHVRIYEWDGTEWSQRGNDIDGEAAGDRSGRSVSLSWDGSVVAIGSRHNWGPIFVFGGAGHVRIYEWDGTEWSQRGNDIDGGRTGDASGEAVSLSADGTIVAIGAKAHSFSEGQVRIYEWDGPEWIQRGNDFNGHHELNLGSTVSLSADGTFVAIGNSGNYVSVYQWDETGPPPEPDDPTLAELGAQISQLQAQIDNISLTPGPQGPPGEDGAPGADAPCKPCADVASAAVALACKILHANPPNYIQEIRDTAEVVVATLMISANVCELDCDIGEEINAAIANALNK